MSVAESLQVVFAEPGKPGLTRRRVGDPKPGQALCKTLSSAISTGTETFCLRGRFDPGTNWANWVRYPFYPGYCASGVVESVGAGTTEEFPEIRPGVRVAARGQHQERFVADGSSLIPIPASVTDEEAALLPLAITAQQGVRRAEVRLGETAVVIGAGLIGLFTIQYLALMGCRRVIAIDTAAARLARAGRMGATHLIEKDVAAAREEVAALTGSRMADVVFEATGSTGVLEHATPLLRRMGRCILVGDSPTPSAQRMGPRVVADSISILGIHMTMSPADWSEFAPWSYREMASLVLEFVSTRRMILSDLITHRFYPSEAESVYQQLERDRSQMLGVIFDWSAPR